MKKLLLLCALVVSLILVESQDNFKWDKVTEIEGTKDQLFSKAKMVLASDFHNSKKVTRDNDKEAGVLYVKAQVRVFKPYGFNSSITYYFQYELTILVKDNKARVLLNNVINTDIDQNNTLKFLSLVPVSTKYPAKNDKAGKKEFGLKAKDYFEIMLPLRNKLQAIFDLIVKDMESKSIINDDW